MESDSQILSLGNCFFYIRYVKPGSGFILIQPERPSSTRASSLFTLLMLQRPGIMRHVVAMLVRKEDLSVVITAPQNFRVLVVNKEPLVGF